MDYEDQEFYYRKPMPKKEKRRKKLLHKIQVIKKQKERRLIMEQYISKSALVAEIEKMQDAYIAKLESRDMGHEEAVMASISYVNGINDVINSLEVKEVDLEKEISFQWSKFCLSSKDRGSFVKVAEHFFELGLKAQKGEKI